MIGGLAHLDHDNHHRCNERNRSRYRPARSVKRAGCRGENDKHAGPSKLKRPRHAHDVAKQEEMREHEADHEPPPPGHHRERERGDCTDDEDDHVERRQSKAWSEGMLFISVGHESLVDRDAYGSPRHQRMP